MEFFQLETQVKDWIQKCETDFDLEKNESERQFSFKSGTDPEVTFSVVCPETGCKWLFWSTNESFHESVQGIQDFCDSSREKTLPEALDKFYGLIKSVIADSGDGSESDDGGYDDDYYMDQEDLTEQQEPSVARDEQSGSDDDAETFFGGAGSPAAMQRLLKDMKNMQKEAKQFGIDGAPRGDNLFLWDVKLTGFPDDTRLGKDLKEFAKKYNREPVIYLEMQFPPDYPMAPPFVRVIRPRFRFLTGHVTIGGSICMEMLTRSGWRPTNDIESILVQIRSEIMSDPNARLDSNSDREYGALEAKEAFDRMVSRYGWNK